MSTERSGAGLPYEELLDRLAVAEQTLGAITAGEVDGLVVTVDGVPRVFTLDGSDTFYRALVEQMPEGAAAVNSDGMVLYANTSLADLLGVPGERLPGTALQGHVAPSQRGLLTRLLRDPEPHPAVELLLSRDDGATVPVSVSVRPLDGPDQGVRCLVIVDLTARRRAEEDVRHAEARFRGAFDSAPIGMALLGLDGVVEQVNEALCQLALCPPEELVGRPLPWLEPTVAHDAMAALADNGQDELVFNGRLLRGPDPVWVTVHWRLLPSAGAGGRVITQVQDDSERHRHEQQLRHAADHDQLTGLLNRRGFDGLVADQLRGPRRGGALLVLDIDHFKYINDTGGHQLGDEVLVHFAQTLRTQVREGDVVARLGGDEFAVLLPNGDAMGTAEHLLGAARDVVVGALDGRRLTVSIGAVEFDDGDQSASEVMTRADLAMYDSKEAGRDRFTLARLPSASTHGERLPG